MELSTVLQDVDQQGHCPIFKTPFGARMMIAKESRVGKLTTSTRLLE